MRITPHYGEPPVLRIDTGGGDLSVPVLRQRRRLADLVAGFEDAQWSTPSRCDQWSVQDVVAHLLGTDQFWAASIAAGLAGAPTRYLEGFDPVTTPAQMVEGLRPMAPSELTARYRAAVDAVADLLTDLDQAAWSMVAEAPPGHIALQGVASHALWDAWIHERDIVLPLGLSPTIEEDEVAACLRYAAALGPAFLSAAGSTRRGILAVKATDPDVSFLVEVGPTVVVTDLPRHTTGPCLEGDAAVLLEGLSFRGPLDHRLAEGDRWLLGGLDQVFEVAPVGG